MSDWIAAGSVLAGALIVLLAAVGLNRFDGVLAKMHPATKSATLGMLLVVGGAALRVDASAVPTLLLVGVLQLLTAPIAAHLIGRAAYWTLAAERDRLHVDELAEHESEGP
ncbi:MAG TPA: monovalent cation/H(+) antiporter subunit G [Actinomycetota bacterium]|nr:monovalent cation/H(+) antiporter subunit G [Actinomycetota bacterium]